MSPQQQQQQQPVRSDKRTVGFMDKPAPGSHTQDSNFKAQGTVSGKTWSAEGDANNTRKKKNYQRYPKPPYSYLAMIAMVIQRSPERKLTLSEILKEISTLFPFFKGNYKGWRDSVRHNLSSYDCFVKVLKDPGKPQGKGNFWAVELSRVPPELLKRQNTAVSRQDETIFAQDLAPYILQGHQLESEPSHHPVGAGMASAPQEDLFRPKLESSFAIDSLLHSLQPAVASADAHGASRDCLCEMGHSLPSPAAPPAPPPTHPSATRCVSASSASPASTSSSSSSSDEDWKQFSRFGKRLPPEGEAGSDSYEDYRPPLHKSARREIIPPPWELPTSYAKYAPPNAVAPPSMRFGGGSLMPLHSGFPLYGYGSSPMTHGHLLSPAYWPLIPSSRVSVQAPPMGMDLDNLLQAVPPNKSVFDLLVPTTQNSNHAAQSLYSMQSRAPMNRYHQF